MSLGLVAKQMRVEQSIEVFIKLCKKAFVPREFNNAPILGTLATLNHGSKWKTTPLHEALEKALGNDLLFGGKHKDRENYATKVAVVATKGSGDQPLIIANYNREEAVDSFYAFDCTDDPELSLSIWQAAAATSAAPSFFKPFRCLKNGKTYHDGALYHNNPVRVAWRERKLLWPDVSHRPPDIFLSLGTGQNKSEIDGKLEQRRPALSKRKTKMDRETEANRAALAAATSRSNDQKRSWGWKGVKGYFEVLVSLLPQAFVFAPSM